MITGLRRVAVATVIAVGMSGGVFVSDVGAAVPKVSVVASGLNNPRGVTFAHGRLYVAEAGTGGSDCPAGAKGPTGGPLCVGRTGALAVLSDGVADPVLTGLLSLSDLPGGVAAEGIADVTGAARGVRVIYGESVVGLLSSLPHGAALTRADNAAARHQLGQLVSLIGGRQAVLADVGGSDFAWAAVHQNLVPDQFPDANPNALVRVGRMTYVVDAASNTLDGVDQHGGVRQLAFFPNPRASDSVPTCVAAGPGGNLYIGELAPGAALNAGVIYRYKIATHRLSVWKRGFNVVDGCGFDRAGNFYAVEFQAHGFDPGPTGNPAGDIIEIARNGKRTVLGAGRLFFPQGFATDSHGNVYVSNWSILTGTPAKPGAPTGQVVRLSH
ncbi:MAG: ScyD/ScyE family protein [Solirubrobacteraceae bacterium]